jgi:hypothetical protein
MNFNQYCGFIGMILASISLIMFFVLAIRTTNHLTRYIFMIDELVQGMKNWAADEDGIHPQAWPAYYRACKILKEPVTLECVSCKQTDVPLRFFGYNNDAMCQSCIERLTVSQWENGKPI